MARITWTAESKPNLVDGVDIPTASVFHQLRDELQAVQARLGSLAVQSVDLATSFNVTDTAYMDVLSLTFTATANERVLVCATGLCLFPNNSSCGIVTIRLDSTDIGSEGLSGVGTGALWLRGPLGITYPTDALSAGSHTVKLRARRGSSPDATWVVCAAARLSVVRGLL